MTQKLFQNSVDDFKASSLAAINQIRNNDLGAKFDIDTFTTIVKGVAEQKFYTEKVSDFIPVNVYPIANWSDKVVTITSSLMADGNDGIIDTGSNNDRLASVDAGLQPIYTPVKTWAKQVVYSLVELNQVQAGDWNLVQEKEKARKRDWDLNFVQRIAFNGDAKYGLKGLYSLTGCTENTTLITKRISTMSQPELNAFARQVVAAFRANCHYTANPDTFVMPEDDFLGLNTYYDSVTQYRTKMECLKAAFVGATGNGNFQILKTAYGMQAINKSKNLYCLYSKEADTLRIDMPVDYTITQTGTVNGFMYANAAYGRMTGVTLVRPAQFMYFSFIDS